MSTDRGQPVPPDPEAAPEAALVLESAVVPAVAPEPAPNLFLRVVTLPPGAPWEQAAAAKLEALNGAPLDPALLAFKVSRLGRWAPRQSARYAIAYARRAEVTRPFAVTRSIEGTEVTFSFAPPTSERERTRGIAIWAGAAALAVGCSVLACLSALDARRDAETRLAEAEIRAVQLETQARRLSRMRQDARLIEAAGVERASLSVFLSDLAWASRARDPKAQIGAVRWSRGSFRIETRSAASPFMTADRQVTRLSEGVWDVAKPGAVR